MEDLGRPGSSRHLMIRSRVLLWSPILALVCVAGSLRAAAVSMAGVLVAIHLASRGLSPTQIGFVLSAGVLASAAASTALTRYV